MLKEEIIILDEVIDDPVGTEAYCCFFIFTPFRSL